MTEITRKTAGVRFETDVLSYLDQLAEEQGRNRSFMINQIVRIYSRIVKMERAEREAGLPKEILPEKEISF